MKRLITLASIIATLALTFFAMHLISTVFFWLLFVPAGLSILFFGSEGESVPSSIGTRREPGS